MPTTPDGWFAVALVAALLLTVGFLVWAHLSDYDRH